MRGAAADRRHDAGRDGEARDVGGAGVGTHQDHRVARWRRAVAALCGVEGRASDGNAGRGAGAGACRLVRRSTSRWSGERGEIDPVKPLQRFGRRDQSFLDEVDGEPQRGARRPLRRAGLQDPQFAVLDRELDVLDVAELLFEPPQRLAQLRRDRRKLAGDRLLRIGCAAAGDDVLALRIEHEVDDRLRRAGRRIARECHAGAG